MAEGGSKGRRWAALAALAALCVLGTALYGGNGDCGANATVVAVNSSAAGPPLGAFGAISGGGASSRLLQDYPKPVASDVLDLLFKPQFGAALQLLKVEIGGDAQTTNGAEASHMHSADDLDLTRGYEWWIMTEAKKRNPDILTYALSWAFPAWVSGGNTHDPFREPDHLVNYTLEWVLGARDVYGVELDYLGVWNEKWVLESYVKLLRAELDKHGLRTQIIINDSNREKELCSKLTTDLAYRASVGAVGFHYPHDDLGPGTWDVCRKMGLPVWSSEESSSYGDANGGACWARVLAAHYVESNITGDIMWNLLGAYYHGTLYYGSSMFTAVQPWSGFFESETMPALWATAHYTQFTKPGWRWQPVGAGSGKLQHGGYFVSFVSPDSKHLTVVIVKISHAHASCIRPPLAPYDTKTETVQVQIPARFAGALYGWASNFEADEATLFEPFAVNAEPDGAGRAVVLEVRSGNLITLTTVAGGRKGQPPSQKGRRSQPAFPMPYSDNFSRYNCSGCYARYLADQEGAFEVHDGILRQMTPTRPIEWVTWGRNFRAPLTVLGNLEWEDVLVSIRARLPANAPASGAAACVAVRSDQKWDHGVVLCANTTSWQLTYGGPLLFHLERTVVVARGTLSVEPGQWFNLSLGAQLDKVQATVNGTILPLNKVRLRERDNGFAAIGTNGYHPVEFAALDLQPLGDRWQAPSRPLAESGARIGTAPCAANGVVDPAQAFELRATYQVRHVPSQLCVSRAASNRLQLVACKHGAEEQLFPHEYSAVRWKNTAIHHAGEHVLWGDDQGHAFLDSPKASHGAGAWNSWTAFPNSNQLRNQRTISSQGPARCLAVTSAGSRAQEA